MIIFRSSSDNNIYKAEGEMVWQCDSMPLKLKVGDAAFIKVNGKDDVQFLGLVESIAREDVLVWPDMDFGSLTTNVPTIRFKKVDRKDFNESQGGFNYDKYQGQEIISEENLV